MLTMITVLSKAESYSVVAFVYLTISALSVYVKQNTKETHGHVVGIDHKELAVLTDWVLRMEAMMILSV